MLLERRRTGSQRTKAPLRVTIEENFGGQHGHASIVFKGEDDVWYTLRPETADDVRELMRQAHVIHQNFREPR